MKARLKLKNPHELIGINPILLTKLSHSTDIAAANLMMASNAHELDEAIIFALETITDETACLYQFRGENIFLRSHATPNLPNAFGATLDLSSEMQEQIADGGIQLIEPSSGLPSATSGTWLVPLCIDQQPKMLLFINRSARWASQENAFLMLALIRSAIQAQHTIRHDYTRSVPGLETLIASISTPFFNLDESKIDEVISQTLKAIGEFTESDRTYYFSSLGKNDQHSISNTHEWCSKGITPEIANLQELPFDAFPWMMKELRLQNVVSIPNTTQLPEAAASEKKSFLARGIKSLILVPYIKRGDIAGFLGYDSTRKFRTWDQGAISLLQVTAALIGEARSRATAENELFEQAKRNDLISRVSRYFVNLQTEGLTASISCTLSDLGEFLNAERIILWRKTEYFDGSYAVWTPGDTSFQNEQISPNEEVLGLKRTSKLSAKSSSEAQFEKRTETETMLNIPLFRLGKPVASLAVHHSNPTSWQREDKALLQVMLAMMIDALEFHQMRETRERENSFASALIQGSGALLIVLDSEARIVRFNPAAERALGYDESEVLGKNALDLFVCTKDHTAVHALRNAIAKGAVQKQIEDEWTTKDGNRRRIAWINRMLLNEDGTLGHLVMSGNDVTNYRKLEKEILNIAEEERNRLGQDLHDGLGQQLAGIEFMSQALIQRMDEGQDAAASATQIHEISKLIRQSISQTRDISRILAPISLAKNGLAHALEDLAQTTTKHMGIRCIFVHEGTLRVDDLGTSVHLFRIAQEAVSNAIKHGKPDIVEIALFTKFHQIDLSITDDGKGMVSSDISGNGMGVRLMHHRANIVNGELLVESRPGTGSCITCTIRLSAEDFPVVKEETGYIKIKNLF